MSRDFLAFLAEDNGRTIGCLFLVVQEKPANPRFPGGRTGLLLIVFTYPAYRRKGVAYSLLSTAIEEAKKMALSYIELRLRRRECRYMKNSALNKRRPIKK